jgi:transcriptional regulator with XRE-family HTH domain
MNYLVKLGSNLKAARKMKFPEDDMKSFALRIGTSRATLQKMEKGDLSVSLEKYINAAELLECTAKFETLFLIEKSLFDE